MRLLYYKHPALVKPSLPALKPLRSLQPRHVLRPSGKNSPYVQKLRALPVQGVTSVMKMAPSSGKRMACAPHCFSLPTGCTRLLWPRLKAHLPASSPPPSRFSRLYTIPCLYSPWHKAEIHRPRQQGWPCCSAFNQPRQGHIRSHSALLRGFPLASGSSCMDGSHLLQAVFRPVSSYVAPWWPGIP